MQITIDLAQDDQSSWRGGSVEWSDPCSIEDTMGITLHFGPVDVVMSYGQFETFLDNVLRWRWSVPSETGPADITAENPPPDWDAHVLALHREIADERGTLAVEFEEQARNHGLLPGPPDGDKLGLRYFLAGRSAGMQAGLLRAAEIVRERAARFDPAKPGGTDEPSPEKKRRKRDA